MTPMTMKSARGKTSLLVFMYVLSFPSSELINFLFSSLHRDFVVSFYFYSMILNFLFRHNLPLISIMNKDASINDNGGSYAGLDRFACRDKIWSDMETSGLTIKVDPHLQRVPRSQRCVWQSKNLSATILTLSITILWERWCSELISPPSIPSPPGSLRTRYLC